MKRIYKYLLEVTDVQKVAMPKGAAVLTVQVQNEHPCIWAEVDPEAPTIKRRFVIYGTGHPMSDDKAYRHVGSFQLHGGRLVFHLYTDGVEYSD